MEQVVSDIGNEYSNVEGSQDPLPMMSLPNEFDTSVTLLYKSAYLNQVPTRLLVRDPTTKQFIYFIEYMDTLYRQGDPWPEIATDILEINPAITLSDIKIAIIVILQEEYPDQDYYEQVDQAIISVDQSTTKRYQSNQQMISDLDAWNLQVQSDYNEELPIMTKINNVQSILSQNPITPDEFPLSPINIITTTTSFKPRLVSNPNSRIDARYGIDIFDSMVVSPYVPFIEYHNDLGEVVYKVYTGDKIGDDPNYSVSATSMAIQVKSANTIYIRLWLGDPESTEPAALKNASKDSFFEARYNLNANVLIVDTPVDAFSLRRNLVKDPKIAFNRLQDAMPSLVLGNGTQIKVKGDFDIWGFTRSSTPSPFISSGINFDESTFLHMILVEDFANVYFYVEENIKPFALKHRFDIHYRSLYTDFLTDETKTKNAYISNYSSVTATLTHRINSQDRTVDLQDTKATLPINTSYLHLGISEAESIEEINRFVKVFCTILKIYQGTVESLRVNYRSIIPGFDDLEEMVMQQRKSNITVTEDSGRKVITKTYKGERNLTLLQKAAADIFVKNYSRQCPTPHPIPIDPDKIDDWRNTTVVINGVEHPRQVMPFPHDNPKVYLVCNDDQKPFPGVKANRILSNIDKYPYIPCCYASDQTNNSTYLDYMRGVKPTKNLGAKGETLISTLKVISTYKFGQLPIEISKLLSLYSPDSKILRHGIPQSPSSLLEAVCIAIDHDDYIQTPEADRMDYIVDLRLHIANNINISLIKQEMYNYRDEDIYSMISDPEIFLDPYLFYRAIEETFNINIFVFTKSGKDPILELPRHKIFHARPPRLDRASVLIFKNWGTESDNLTFPHCELIVDHDINSDVITKIFDSNMTQLCTNILRQVASTINWHIDFDQSIIPYSNVYYKLDSLADIDADPVAQYLDSNGKVRAFIMEHNKQRFTMIVIPAQPENLPGITLSQLPPGDYALITKLKGQFSGVTYNQQNQVNGLWYNSNGLENCEYYPIQAVNLGTAPLPLGPEPPLIAFGKDRTNRLTLLRRVLNIVTQLIHWVYVITINNTGIRDSFEFEKNFIRVYSGPVTDSSTFYDISKVPRILPAYNDPGAAIAYMSNYIPTLFDGQTRKIIMYNNDFAIKMVSYLKDFTNVKHIPMVIENYYEGIDNFKPLPNGKIFTSTKELYYWINSHKTDTDYDNRFTVRKSITIALASTEDPYLFEDQDKKIYIVQNLSSHDMRYALFIAKYWSDNKINLGYTPISSYLDTVPDLSNLPHVIYTMGPNNIPVPYQDHSNGNPNYLRIFYYGTQAEFIRRDTVRYAAFLELL